MKLEDFYDSISDMTEAEKKAVKINSMQQHVGHPYNKDLIKKGALVSPGDYEKAGTENLIKEVYDYLCDKIDSEELPEDAREIELILKLKKAIND